MRNIYSKKILLNNLSLIKIIKIFLYLLCSKKIII